MRVRTVQLFASLFFGAALAGALGLCEARAGAASPLAAAHRHACLSAADVSVAAPAAAPTPPDSLPPCSAAPTPARLVPALACAAPAQLDRAPYAQAPLYLREQTLLL